MDAALRRTRIGRMILGEQPQGNEQDFYGDAAWLLNHVIVCKVLTGLLYGAIGADAIISAYILANSRQGGFCFTVPRREVTPWAMGQPVVGPDTAPAAGMVACGRRVSINGKSKRTHVCRRFPLMASAQIQFYDLNDREIGNL
jgi:hypothetical protein